MKRQARPFVVETKRSRKAPTNLWASTPLLQQELAAASAPEPKAEAIFADRSKDQAAEPARRILQSLIVEAPTAETEADEPEEPTAPRRRTRRGAEGDADARIARDPTAADIEPSRAEPARRGRPRRAVASEGAEASASEVAVPVASKRAAKAGAKASATRSKGPVSKVAASKAVASKTPATKALPAAPTRKGPSTPAAMPSLTALPDAAIAETDATTAAPAPRSRAPRNPAAAALLPGQRWKRRLPQRLW